MKVFPLCLEKEDWVMRKNDNPRNCTPPTLIGFGYKAKVVLVDGNKNLIPKKDKDPSRWMNLHLFQVELKNEATRGQVRIGYMQMSAKLGGYFNKIALPNLTITDRNIQFAMRQGPSEMYVFALANKPIDLFYRGAEFILSESSKTPTNDCIFLF